MVRPLPATTSPLGEHDTPVSRGRYEREKRARIDAENLLEQKSRELFETNERLQHALKKEREIAEMRVRFISTLSHEFRTPLTVIKASVERLAKIDSRDRASVEAKCEAIQSAVSRLTELVEKCTKPPAV